jgi:probable HAF family extracellular repeat protein
MQRTLRNLIAVTTLAGLALIAQLAAQDKPSHHQQYKLYDMGTFGGGSSVPSIFAVSATTAGVIGGSETSLADPFDPNCLFAHCQVGHAFLGRHGVAQDLGALPGNNGLNSSYAFALNESGTIVGISEDGTIDPATGYPETVAVAWQHGSLTNLGTLGGAQSVAAMVNNRGQIAGWAMNDIPDPFSSGIEFLGFGGSWPGTTQVRAMLWDAAGGHDLGTLGGPSAVGSSINQAGQIIGQSYTNNTPNPSTGIPTVDAFIWERGKMTDLGTFGGNITVPFAINNRGEVVGQGNLPGDQAAHGFLWSHNQLTDLNLGGIIAAANWISDSGEVVGFSNLPGDQVYHAFTWSRQQITDLGTLPGHQCSKAFGVNSHRQVVGYSYGTCDVFETRSAFISENGEPMADLNSLVQPPSDFHIYNAWFITERGEIVAQGLLPNGEFHVLFLVPDGSCDHDCERMLSSQQSRPSGTAPSLGSQTSSVAPSHLHSNSPNRLGKASLF